MGKRRAGAGMRIKVRKWLFLNRLWMAARGFAIGQSAKG
jgi:hypothetical protein